MAQKKLLYDCLPTLPALLPLLPLLSLKSRPLTAKKSRFVEKSPQLFALIEKIVNFAIGKMSDSILLYLITFKKSMRMKKIFLVLAAALCVATVSAQNKFESSVKQAAQTIASQKWSVGLRATYGVQVVSECFYAGDKYFEGRLGLGLGNGAGADFTALHNWNCCNWDWTPSVGKWYLDAGVGANVGGNGGWVYAGVAGDVKFGIKFNKVPIRLAVDYTPVIGVHVIYGHSTSVTDPNTGTVTTVRTPSKLGFHDKGFYNFALSATYCF